jgi:hypothetical protein
MWRRPPRPSAERSDASGDRTPASVAFDLDPAFDSDLHPNSLSFRRPSEARQEESAVSRQRRNSCGDGRLGRQRSEATPVENGRSHPLPLTLILPLTLTSIPTLVIPTRERSETGGTCCPRKRHGWRGRFPSRTRKLSPAGPMVLHAPSVWERRSLPA